MHLETCCRLPSSITISPITLEASVPGLLLLKMRRRSLLYSTIIRSLVFSNYNCPCRHSHTIVHALPFPSAAQLSSSRNTQLRSSFLSSSSAVTSIYTTQEENWSFANARETPTFELGAKFGAEGLENPKSPCMDDKRAKMSQERKLELDKLTKSILQRKDVIRQLDICRNWITREDAIYLANCLMGICETDAVFKLYKWSQNQKWFEFDFSLATKVADHMGKEGKFSKCRDIFDHIINNQRVPSKTTFHIMTLAYISLPVQGSTDEACNIYNRMIQLGGYQPRLDLHNALFHVLISKQGDYSKRYLKQAEFIFHNLVTSDLEVHRDVYAGLIWLHSYQDSVDMARIWAIREEMKKTRVEESVDILLSLLRACSKQGDLDETERTWKNLLESQENIPQPAFIYKMEAYSKSGKPLTSLEIFKEMQVYLSGKRLEPPGCYKIIEILAKAQHVELCESLVADFRAKGIKSLIPCFIYMMEMYLSLASHEKIESMFFECIDNRNMSVYNIYLDSLVNTVNIVKAEILFNKMVSAGETGVNTRTCNSILRGYISVGDFLKAEKVYDLMCEKKYDIDPPLMEKLEYTLSLSGKTVKKPISMKLSKEQREILMGLLLGGMAIESDEGRRNHAADFEFDESSETHVILRKHIYGEFHEWLHPYGRITGDEDVPFRFRTISHSYFSFYADQFRPRGGFSIPKLIHRWVSPRVLAYWYMYGGCRMSSGGVVLKVKGNEEGVGRLVEAIKGKSLDCRVKKKGKVSWIGLLGSNASWFLKLVEPYILDSLKDHLGVSVNTLKDTEAQVGQSDFEGSDV